MVVVQGRSALLSSALGKKYWQLIMTRKSNSNAIYPFKKRTTLWRKKKRLKDAYEFRRIAPALKSHESSCRGHKQHPEMEKSLEFVKTEYHDLKSIYVAAKKDLKALGEWLNILSAQVVEIAIEIDNLVQHSYSVDVKLVGMPETAETGCKIPTMDTSKLFVRIFDVKSRLMISK